ncbi:MAG: polyprenyl synthetase family protein [Candidatus Acidulodesulfobacterium acidiphilum]|uniref:Polyprenyl synthetase family protein n=1 Tax=Candidatus Acidulodesulfobacterium acidiphilum TaxID=2597224 RepID=A0A520X8Z1_9DELT|nr:MAG: polyprenyl synthetase family protein [Candidatus Acidulodesulfobacterium acidiphilum]
MQNISFDYIENELEKVEEQFEKHLITETPLIHKVAEYVISSGGKRIRPILLIVASKLCGYDGNDHISLAAVIEFIHTATLLHDDVVDNAPLRRGKASANTIFGNEAAVLVGDYLFAKSFKVLSDINNIKVIKSYSDATTLMAEGEVKELVKTADIKTGEKDYLDIIIKKTAVLFACASEVGAIIAGKEEKCAKKLYDYGLNIGIAFQLMDDALDYISDKEFGKFIGNDLKEGKLTLPLIHAIERASQDEKEVIINIIYKKRLASKDLRTVLSLVKSYGSIDYTISKAKDAIKKAKKNLDIFPDSKYKNSLIDIADYIIDRKL